MANTCHDVQSPSAGAAHQIACLRCRLRATRWAMGALSVRVPGGGASEADADDAEVLLEAVEAQLQTCRARTQGAVAPGLMGRLEITKKEGQEGHRVRRGVRCPTCGGRQKNERRDSDHLWGRLPTQRP